MVEDRAKWRVEAHRLINECSRRTTAAQEEYQAYIQAHQACMQAHQVYTQANQASVTAREDVRVYVSGHQYSLDPLDSIVAAPAYSAGSTGGGATGGANNNGGATRSTDGAGRSTGVAWGSNSGATGGTTGSTGGATSSGAAASSFSFGGATNADGPTGGPSWGSFCQGGASSGATGDGTQARSNSYSGATAAAGGVPTAGASWASTTGGASAGATDTVGASGTTRCQCCNPDCHGMCVKVLPDPICPGKLHHIRVNGVEQNANVCIMCGTCRTAVWLISTHCAPQLEHRTPWKKGNKNRWTCSPACRLD